MRGAHGEPSVPQGSIGVLQPAQRVSACRPSLWDVLPGGRNREVGLQELLQHLPDPVVA